MAKLSKDNTSGTLHPRENATGGANLSSNSAEFGIDSHGNTIVMMDLRGTFTAVIDLQGTVDGVNWNSIAMRPVNEMGSFQFGASAPGTYWANCAGYRILKAKVTSYTSGTINANLLATIGELAELTMADMVQSATGTAGNALTVTLPAVNGLTHCITHIEIARYATAAQTANATPTVVTTTGLPGNLAWTIPREAATLGSVYDKILDFTRPLRNSADSSATTITAPSVTGIIWRISVFYFLAP